MRGEEEGSGFETFACRIIVVAITVEYVAEFVSGVEPGAVARHCRIEHNNVLLPVPSRKAIDTQVGGALDDSNPEFLQDIDDAGNRVRILAKAEMASNFEG